MYATNNNLKINGGGTPRAFRSFGDSGRDKRSRIFLTDSTEVSNHEDILQKLKTYLRNNLLKALCGWEYLYEVPEEALIILSSDLNYLLDPAVDDILDQAVVVSRNRVVATLRAPATSRTLQNTLMEYNLRNPQNMVRKIISHDSRLLYNLQKARVSVHQWSRPRDLPPPLPHGLDCTLEGAELERLEFLVTSFLQGALTNMTARGFAEPPVAYVTPQVYFLKDRRGEVMQSRFFLTWAKEEHAVLFYILWNNYHWGDDRQTFILKTRNPMMDRIGDRAATRHILLEPTAVRPRTFLQFYMDWSDQPNLQYGAALARLADA